jgi:glycosyltransferase involved in cell wall biosynthesis
VKISIVIPVYNEEKTIKEIVKKIDQVNLEKEIIIVDDGSKDATPQLLKDIQDHYHCKLICKKKNEGKGAALREGFQQVTGDIVIIQDADLEYEPNDYFVLIDPILKGNADVVYGSRFLGYPRRVLYFWHTLGNNFLTLFSNMLNDLTLTDMETCYKVFKASILREVTFRSNRFGFEPEFTAKMAKKKYRIYEVPVSYYGRSYKEGKKITWRDGVAALYWILYYRIKD